MKRCTRAPGSEPPRHICRCTVVVNDRDDMVMSVRLRCTGIDVEGGISAPVVLRMGFGVWELTNPPVARWFGSSSTTSTGRPRKRTTAGRETGHRDRPLQLAATATVRHVRARRCMQVESGWVPHSLPAAGEDRAPLARPIGRAARLAKLGHDDGPAGSVVQRLQVALEVLRALLVVAVLDRPHVRVKIVNHRGLVLRP